MSFLMAPVRWIVGAFTSIIPSLTTDLLLKVLRFILEALVDRSDVDRAAVRRLVQALRDIRPGDNGPEESLADFIEALNDTTTDAMLEPGAGTVGGPIEATP